MASEPSAAAPPSPARALGELFLVSVLILFLELACIRWFPAHVLFLTFFTNVVLLACFLGMSVGCLAARHRRNYLLWTPGLLLLALAAGHGIEAARGYLEQHLDVGNQASPHMVYFGTEYHSHDVATFRIPIEVVGGFFFLVIALAMVGPGQELGRALDRVPNRVQAYTVNILGSVVGIVLFAAFSWLQLAPFWWFAPVVLGLGYFLIYRDRAAMRLWQWAPQVVLLLAILPLAGIHSGVYTFKDGDRERVFEFLWSPYYRIDYEHPPVRMISVNLIGHQQMRGRSDEDSPGSAYALPHLLHRDAGGKPFKDVLVIGAGSGNDLSRALQFGDPDMHIDAVEIDPVIQRLGRQDHPDQPYADPRVHPVLDDGRNFLRSSERQYDLIVYALVDSLVLQSSYSNIRLESYLFTKQAFEDVKRHLKPGGKFVMYNYFRQGWIVARLYKGLEEVFGQGNPLVLTMPYISRVEPEASFSGFTVITAGDTEPLRQAFAAHPYYWMRQMPPSPSSPNGFEDNRPKTDSERWDAFGPAEVQEPVEPLRTADDNWPFLYLRRPMIPDLSLRGMGVMGTLALILILLFLPRGKAAGGDWGILGRMFFLGAGFMLIETKAVVHMALLFGSTWIVNSVVFFAVLVMILLANLFVLKVKPQTLWPYYVGLLLTLALNVVVPLDFFLGMPRAVQVVLSCALVFAPIAFAGVIFAVSFSRTARPDHAFGANIAGAMLGGLAENTSMYLGFQLLVLVAIAFYVLSAVLSRAPAAAPAAEKKVA